MEVLVCRFYRCHRREIAVFLRLSRHEATALWGGRSVGYPNVVSGRLLGIVFRGAGLERWHKAFKLNWALAPEASAKNEGYFWDKTPVANYFDVDVVDEERHKPGGACYRNRSSTLHY